MMKPYFLPILSLTLGLASCGVEEFIRKNDDRYAKPGALDLPLTGIYKTFDYKFLDKYRVSHQWLNTSTCEYSMFERPSQHPGKRTLFYEVQDIYEEEGVTKQRGSKANFDQYVRIKSFPEQVYKDSTTGQTKVAPAYKWGYQPLCSQTWWTSSHYLAMRLHKLNLEEFDAFLTRNGYPQGSWKKQEVSGLTWRAYELAEDQLISRKGIGGPYKAWLLPVGDTGYTLALEMGASKESLRYPQAHAAIKKVFYHLVSTVKIKSLAQ